MSEIQTFLEQKISQLQNYSQAGTVFLFRCGKDNVVRLVLPVDKSGEAKKSRRLEWPADGNKNWLSKDEADEAALKSLFDDFGLHYFTAPIRYRNEAFYLGLRLKSDTLLSEGNIFIALIYDYIKSEIRGFRLENELQRYAQKSNQMITELGALHQISRAIDSAKSLDSLLSYIVKKSMNLINAESGSLMLLVDDGKELEFKVALGPKSDGVKPFRLPLGKGIAGWVAQHSEAILIPDAYADPRFDPSFDKRSGYRTRSYLCVPLVHKGVTSGVMTVLNRMDGQPFNENDKNILTTFASQAALAIENTKLLQAAMEKERLDKELEVASQIQHLLLPQTIPPVKNLDVAATYIPCKAVGGDFYDVIPLKDGKFMFIVADVAGKGVPGALLVSSMQASLIAYLEYVDDLTVIASKLNERIRENTSEDRYITAFLAVYDPKDAAFVYINAGHNPPLFIGHDGTVKELKEGGLFLGFTSWQYETGKLNLQPDDLVFMYTDGLVEAMNEQEEEFGEDRLKKYLLENPHKTAENLMHGVINAVNAHIDGAHLEDDFTLLVVKRK